jgi:hypothetical protein
MVVMKRMRRETNKWLTVIVRASNEPTSVRVEVKNHKSWWGGGRKEEGGRRKEEGGRSTLIVFGWNSRRTVMVEVENEDELIQWWASEEWWAGSSGTDQMVDFAISVHCYLTFIFVFKVRISQHLSAVCEI